MKLNSIFAAAVLGAGLLSGPALADPAAATSPEQAERVQLARQLFDLSGGQAAVDQRVDAIFAMSSKLIAANTPPDAAKFAIAMQRDTADELHALVPSMIDVSVQAYADNLTTQELRDYVAWLSSDSGKSLLRKMPAIREEMTDRSLPMLSAAMPRLQRKVSERVCAELHCTTDERRVVADAMAKSFAPKS